MRPLPDVNSGAGIAFYVILGIFVVLEQRVRLRSWRVRHGTREDRGTLIVVVASVVVGVAGGFALAADVHETAVPDGRWPMFVVGLVLMCSGIAIRQWSVALLGPFFTIDVRVHPDQTVVERGPYRWVRHPSYTGLIMTFVGIGLALGNWAALALLAVVPTAGLVVRIRAEERALLDG
ncbi:MAG TPA: isoprenylcysteine carboxylmethyltransferase family protein, partial [Propionibacteriaceae bacterium]|nr:isoprenylcysteine carboxylmethyltransferase family protein [Propionibacteriaceae bacterium]